MALSWFLYSGIGAATDAQNYSIINTIPICSNGSRICAIYAEVQLLGIPQQRKPIITPTLSTDIITSDSSNTPSANVKLKF